MQANLSDVHVVIPVRRMSDMNARVLSSIPNGVVVHIQEDTETLKGQTPIRRYYADNLSVNYLLLLDDDVVLCPGALQEMLEALETKGAVAVCAEKKPIAHNKFSEGVLKFKEYKNSFIKTGVTLWNRRVLAELMAQMPSDCPTQVGDIVLGDILERSGYNYFKLEHLICEHSVAVSTKGWFQYRYSAGMAMAWFYLCWRKRGYWTMLAKMILGLPLSRSYGVFLYRLGSALGLIKGGLRWIVR